jgi:hypothetical protein
MTRDERQLASRGPVLRIFPERRRAIRLAVLLAVLLGVLGYSVWRTAWWPDVELETAHYVIRSNATPEQTEEAARALEELHDAYMRFFADFPRRGGEPLRVNLYRDREEFRRCHPRAGWAEGFYRKGRCYAYYAALDANPFHWLLHEATHQLNHDVTCLRAPKWLDEGLATYFSTSRYEEGEVLLGKPNGDAYPIWWLCDLHLTGDVDADIRAGSLIPLRAIVSGRGGPDIDIEFNLYYIHWWSLTHFLIEGDEGSHREAFMQLLRAGGGLDAFEESIGPIDAVQAEWHAYLRDLQQQALRGELSPRGRDADRPG